MVPLVLSQRYVLSHAALPKNSDRFGDFATLPLLKALYEKRVIVMGSCSSFLPNRISPWSISPPHQTPSPLAPLSDKKTPMYLAKDTVLQIGLQETPIRTVPPPLPQGIPR